MQFLREVPSEARKVLCAWNKVFLKGYCADLDIEMAGWVDPGLEVQDFGATLPKPLGDRWAASSLVAFGNIWHCKLTVCAGNEVLP